MGGTYRRQFVFYYKRSTFDVYKIALKLTILAEPPKRFLLNGAQLKVILWGKLKSKSGLELLHM